MKVSNREMFNKIKKHQSSKGEELNKIADYTILYEDEGSYYKDGVLLTEDEVKELHTKGKLIIIQKPLEYDE